MRLNRNLNGHTGYPDGMSESEFNDYMAGRPPSTYTVSRPRKGDPAYPVFAAAIAVRELVYGPDRDGWPVQRHEADRDRADGLSGESFGTLLLAAMGAADEADRMILKRAFAVREVTS